MNNEKFKSLIFSDDEINDELLDALIKAGAHEYIQNSTLEIPDSELSDAEFSRELDKKLNAYFAGIKKDSRINRIKTFTEKAKNISLRVAAALLILIVLAAGFVITSEATQIKLLNLYIEQTDISTDFEFTGLDPKKPKINDMGDIEGMFGYIPVPYEMVYENIGEMVNVIHYETLDGGSLQIEISPGGSLTINSEDAITYITEINGVSCYIVERKDYTIAVFTVNNYVYNIFGTLPPEEITKIIENINFDY